MSDPAPQPEPPSPRDPSLSLSAPTRPPPRPVRKLEVWLDLLDRLAERRQQSDASAAALPVQPPSRAQVWLDRTVWQIIRFARWLRPHLASGAVQAHKATRKGWKRGLLAVARSTRESRLHLKGWLLWQWRLLRTDPDRKLAVLGLTGGFIIPMALIIGITHMLPPHNAPEVDAIPLSDASVPAPSVDIIDVSPVEQPETSAEPEPAIAAPPQTAAHEALSASNFRFEYFVQRDERGRLRLLRQAAQAMLLDMFPPGTPAVNVMRFFGEVMLRSGVAGDDATRTARSRCMAMPVNKVFTQRTVTCTYGHNVPLPRHTRESGRSRVFWIMALTYNRDGKLTDLRVHARTTLAAAN